LLSLCGLAACGHSGAEDRVTSDASTAVSTATNAATVPTATGVTSAPPSFRSLKGDEDDDETGENLGNESKDNDADFDNDIKPEPGYNDSDDGPVRSYGHAATSAQETQLRGIVTRYFAAAAKGNGVTGCSLIDAQFVKAIPEDYGRGVPGPHTRAGLRVQWCCRRSSSTPMPN
jgi:hypothetical protein